MIIVKDCIDYLNKYQIAFIRVAFLIYANVMIHLIKIDYLYIMSDVIISSIWVKSNIRHIL